MLAGLPPGRPSSSTAAAALPLLGVLASVIVKLTPAVAVSPSPSVTVNVADADPVPITGLSAVNEYVPSAFTFISRRRNGSAASNCCRQG